MAAISVERGFFKLSSCLMRKPSSLWIGTHSNVLLRNIVRCINDDYSTAGQGKELNLVVSSLRVDRIAASGFGIGRRKMELLLLSGKLYVNKNCVMKSSVKVKCNDILELIDKQIGDIEDTSGKVCVSRIEITDIGETLTKKGNLRISLTRWRNILIDRNYFKQFYRKQKYD